MPPELQDLALAIKRLQHRHHRALDVGLAPLGATLVQWDALREISRHPDSSSHRLAQLTFQTDQSFGSLASRMTARGLIKRVPGPGRALRHRLTPAGEAILRAGHEVVDEVLSESFASLDADERETLGELLRRMLKRPIPPAA